VGDSADTAREKLKAKRKKRTPVPKRTAASRQRDEEARNFAAATSIFVPPALQGGNLPKPPKPKPSIFKPVAETAEQRRVREKAQRVARERYQMGLKYGATGKNDLRAVPAPSASEQKKGILADRSLSPFEKREAIAKLNQRMRTAGPSPIAIGKGIGLALGGVGKDLYGWAEDRAGDLADLPGELLYGDTNQRSPVPGSVQRASGAASKLPGSKEFVRTTTMTPEEQEKVSEAIFGKAITNLFAHGDMPNTWGQAAGLGAGLLGVIPNPISGAAKGARAAAKAADVALDASRAARARGVYGRTKPMEMGKALDNEHAQTIKTYNDAVERSHDAKAAYKPYAKLKTSELDEAGKAAKAEADAAEQALGAARSDELFYRLHKEINPQVADSPERRLLAERLIEEYSGRAGALPPRATTVDEIERIMSFLDEMANRGKHGRMWYEKSAKAILKVARGNKERAVKIAQLLAVYSPQQPILGNTSLAVRALNQYTRKGEVTVGQPWQQRAAENILSGDQAYLIEQAGLWKGRKTNNFAFNFIENIDKRLFNKLGLTGNEVTSDLWMARAFGYLTDAVSEGRYDVIESIVQQIGKERGWKPKQVQAAIWTAIKDASDDVTANIDFATGLKRMEGQINYEAIPGQSVAPELHQAYLALSPAERELFDAQQSRLVDDLLDDLGLPGAPSEAGPGVYYNDAGVIEQSTGARAPILTSLAPSGTYSVEPIERGLFDFAAAAIARGALQETVAWVRPFIAKTLKATDTIVFDLGRPLTTKEANALVESLGESYGIVHTGDDGVMIRNFGGVDSKEFAAAAREAVVVHVEDVPKGVVHYASDGDLIRGTAYEDAAQSLGDAGGHGTALRATQAADRFAAESAGLRERFFGAVGRLVSEESGQFNLSAFRRPGKKAAKAPKPPPTQGPKTLVETVAEAIPGSEPVYAEQAVLRSEERAKRLKEALPALERGGPAGMIEARKALHGVLPKLEWEGFEFLDDASREALNQHALAHPDLRDWERIRVVWAIDKAMKRGVLTPSEVKVLEKAFGEKVAENLGNRENMTIYRWLWQMGIDLWNVPRSLMASYDLSAPFRQGLMSGAGHPILFAKNLKPMVKAFGKEQTYLAHMDEIAGRENFPRYEKGKLAMTDIFGSGSGREEAFPPSIAERTPVIKHGVKSSSRAYSLFLTKQRADVFDYLLEGAAKRGQDIDDPKFLKALGRMINNTTGRGKIPTKHGEDAAQFLNNFFFSPRLLASRFQVFNPEYYWTLYRSGPAGPYLARQAVKDAMLTVGEITLATTMLSQIPGVDVGTNPTSADFGKVRIGDTRIDLAGGWQPMIVLFERMRRGETTASSTGVTRPLGGYGGRNRWELVQRFLEGKMAPTPGIIRDVASDQKTFVGEPLTLGGVAQNNLLPLNVQATWDALKQDGYSVAAISAILGSIGFGTASYPDAAPGESGGGKKTGRRTTGSLRPGSESGGGGSSLRP
jgi:hypothetical protein